MKLENVIFYTIDKSIRSYRVFAQKRLREHGYSITIDQWLILKVLMENPGIMQQEVAEMVFKDNASITRIIDLLVKSNYLKRTVNPKDFKFVGNSECLVGYCYMRNEDRTFNLNRISNLIMNPKEIEYWSED